MYIKFNQSESEFVWKGKLTDTFSNNTLVSADFEIDEPTIGFFGITWKDGVDYLLSDIAIECPEVEEEDYPCSGVMTLEWNGNEPTIGEWLNAFGEPKPRATTVYEHLQLITGYYIGDEGYITDTWNTKLLVETLPWNIIIPVAAIVAVGTGVGIYIKKNQY